MTFSFLLPWGLPLLAAVGAGVAIGAVLTAARFLETNAWAAVGQLVRPLASIGRALLPLALPVAVILLFATRDLSLVVQFLAGVLLAGLIWLFVRGEGEFEHERSQLLDLGRRTRGGLTGGDRVKALTRSALPWAVIGAFGLVVFLFLAGFAWQIATWDSLAGASGDAELVALLLLSIALPFRLFGYATNWYRRVAAVALALLVAQVLVSAGVLHHIGFLGFIFDLGTFSIVLIGVFFAVLVIEAVRVPAPRPPGQFHQGARASGLGTACLSAFGLFVALAIASGQTTGGADKLGPYRAATAPKIVNTYGGPDTDLAWTFAPLLHLEHGEQYGPTGVKSFLANATESGAKKIVRPGEKLSLETLPTICADGSHDPCGTLTCAGCSTDTTTQKHGFLPQGVLYARVARRATDPHVFSGWNPWGARLTTLVQYWIFYLYDRWQTETVVGKVIQEHQGDWEFVAVGLDDANRPLFVALSAHCAGQVVDWNSNLPAAPGHLVDGRIVISDHRLAPGDEVTHPIVAVARGSHANYARSGDNRPPDWGSCSNFPSSALTAVSYASNVRDLTEQGRGGWFAYPRLVSVVNSQNRRLGRPFSYPGSWGTGEFITFGHRDAKHTGDGPKSPPLQGKSWETPIHFFFCGAHWQGRHGTAAQCRA